jgi:hypothetical protein
MYLQEGNAKPALALQLKHNVNAIAMIPPTLRKDKGGGDVAVGQQKTSHYQPGRFRPATPKNQAFDHDQLGFQGSYPIHLFLRKYWCIYNVFLLLVPHVCLTSALY